MPRRHRPVPSACLSSRRNRPHAPADDRAWADAAPRYATLCEFLRKQEPRTSRNARRPGLLLSQELALRGEGNGVPPPACHGDGSTLPSSCESRNPEPAAAPAVLGSCFRRSSRCGERGTGCRPPACWDDDPPEFLRKQEPRHSPRARRPGLLLFAGARVAESDPSPFPPVMLNVFQHPSRRPAPSVREEEWTPERRSG